MRSRIWYHQACMVIITGDRIGGGSQLTGGLYQEAQSIHLDRTSKSSLGPRGWSLSRNRLIGSYCCCQGSRSSCKPCILIMILTNQQHWHILFLCTVTKLCSHSMKGQIMFKCPSCERVTKKVIIKYVPFSLFRFCAIFAVHVINLLWSLNYCLESKGFWKICRPCYGYDACLTFPQTWSIMEGVNGAHAWMLALSS